MTADNPAPDEQLDDSWYPNEVLVGLERPNGDDPPESIDAMRRAIMRGRSKSALISNAMADADVKGLSAEDRYVQLAYYALVELEIKSRLIMRLTISTQPTCMVRREITDTTTGSETGERSDETRGSVSASVYESAVKGRRDFRQAYRDARKLIDDLVACWENGKGNMDRLCEISRGAAKLSEMCEPKCASHHACMCGNSEGAQPETKATHIVEPLESIPAELFDGHAVWLKAGNVKSDDVSRVLDAVVALIRQRTAAPETTGGQP